MTNPENEQSVDADASRQNESAAPRQEKAKAASPSGDVKPDLFVQHLPELRRFLHRLGRETNQGEVALEFDGDFYRINEYDVTGGT
jgi:hypothetical protein